MSPLCTPDSSANQTWPWNVNDKWRFQWDNHSSIRKFQLPCRTQPCNFVVPSPKSLCWGCVVKYVKCQTRPYLISGTVLYCSPDLFLTTLDSKKLKKHLDVPIQLYRDSILIIYAYHTTIVVAYIPTNFMVLWPWKRFRHLPLVLYSRRKFSLVFSSARLHPQILEQQWHGRFLT